MHARPAVSSSGPFYIDFPSITQFFYETMYIHFVQLSFFILLLFGKEKRRRFFWQRGSHYVVFLSLTTLYLQPVLHSTTIKPPRPKYFFAFHVKIALYCVSNRRGVWFSWQFLVVPRFLLVWWKWERDFSSRNFNGVNKLCNERKKTCVWSGWEKLSFTYCLLGNEVVFFKKKIT